MFVAQNYIEINSLHYEKENEQNKNIGLYIKHDLHIHVVYYMVTNTYT